MRKILFQKSKILLYAAGLIFLAFLNIDFSQAGTVTSSQSFFKADSAPKYISVVYTWGSMMVGGLSLIVIAYAGLTYMRSMGNPETISQSKTLISGALIGLFLVLGGYFLLKLMDPRFVELKLSILEIDEKLIGGADAWREAPTKCETQSDCQNFNVPMFKAAVGEDKVFYKPVGTTCIDKECRVPKGKVCGVFVTEGSLTVQESFDTTWGQKCQKGTTCKLNSWRDYVDGVTWADGSQIPSNYICGNFSVGCQAPKYKTCL